MAPCFRLTGQLVGRILLDRKAPVMRKQGQISVSRVSGVHFAVYPPGTRGTMISREYTANAVQHSSKILGVKIERVSQRQRETCTTVFPAKPLFYRASGLSRQRVASRCGNHPCVRVHSSNLYLKNGGVTYASVGLAGQAEPDWRRERGVSMACVKKPYTEQEAKKE